MCPHCRNHAPIVYRGVMAYCTACGAPRMPLASSSVTLAGKPARVGGTIAKAIGWLTLVGGLSLGLMLGLLFTAIFPASLLGVALGVPIALASSIIGWLLLRSGKSITESGVDAQRDARIQAAYALAYHRGGVVRAHDLAQSIGVTTEQADAFLTDLAKTKSDQVSLEIDDAGGVYYRISAGPGAPIPQAWPAGDRVRVEPPHAPTRVVEGELLTDDEAEADAAAAGRKARRL